MKVKYREIQSMFISMRKVEKDKAGIRWAFALAKNKGKIQNDIDCIIAAEKVMQETEQERIKYCNEHAVKNTSGEPVMENGYFKGVDGKAPELVAFVEKMRKLLKEYNEMLNKETEIDFHMVDFKEVPEQIAPEDFANLMLMIRDEETKE